MQIRTLMLVGCLSVIAGCEGSTDADTSLTGSDVDRTIPQHDSHSVSNKIQILGDDVVPAHEHQNRGVPSLELLLKGNIAFHQGDVEQAISYWRRVIAKHPDTPSWYMAILNSGRVLHRENKYREAIECLKILLANESHRTLDWNAFIASENQTAIQAYLDYWNCDWHFASVLISDCYERLGNMKMARQYAVLARDKFRFRNYCGMALSGADSDLTDRIAALSRRIDKP